MSKRGLRALVAVACVTGGLFAAVSPAQGAVEDPLWVFQPIPAPPPIPPPYFPPPYGNFEGPCGLGVDSAGNFYVSDYYHDQVDVYDPNASYGPQQFGPAGYITQMSNIDPIDGPCGLALDASNHLYVNDYHRAVLRYGAMPSFGASTTISGAEVDGTHPTGVAVDPATGDVYVNERTYVGVYDSSGNLLEEIGKGSLQDGYGIAFSSYPATAGSLYVPDAATDTVKVYDPATDTENPVAVLDGSGTPKGEFVSLRDAAIAVDRVTGEIYLTDDLQPQYTERPQAIAYVFSSTGAYEGHLKYLVTDAMPPGLAVDDSATATQGRVYVTSGNTTFASIYAYGPGAATTAPVALATASLSLAATGTGGGTVRTSALECTTSCEEEVPAGSTVSVSAQADPGSAFVGWSGACSGSAPSCEVQMESSAAVRATFTQAGSEGASSSSGTSQGTGWASTAQLPRATGTIRKHRHHHRSYHHAKGRHR